MISKCYIVGSGNMAHFLCHTLSARGVGIAGIYTRNMNTGENLSTKFQAPLLTALAEIPDEPDSILFLCVPDQAIAVLASQLPLRRKQLLVHTSGSTSLEPLSLRAAAFGCVWPLASINKINPVAESDIPVCIEACDATTSIELMEVAKCISNSVRVLDSTQRRLLHLSAVLTQNFANHLFALATELCADTGVDITLLQPMMRAWIEQLREQSAFTLQTGPARRNDQNTLDAHRALLTQNPDLLKVYDTLTASIRKMYG